MQLCIQYIVLNLTHWKHLAQHFRDFYRSSTYQNRTSCLYHFFNLFDHSFIFFTLSLVNAVVHIFTCYRTIGRDDNNIQFIDIPKFASFRFGCTGHTREFVVHTEIVLQSNSGKSLGCRFHFHPFLSLDSLMQTIWVTTTFHNTTGLFVYNLHLSVNHHILIILFEHGVCFQKLVDGVYTFRFDSIISHQLILLGQFLFFRQFGLVF